ncbi:hypothetical protein CsSME_00053824 [Camellia sinensis var. sinensis]
MTEADTNSLHTRVSFCLYNNNGLSLLAHHLLPQLRVRNRHVLRLRPSPYFCPLVATVPITADVVTQTMASSYQCQLHSSSMSHFSHVFFFRAPNTQISVLLSHLLKSTTIGSNRD